MLSSEAVKLKEMIQAAMEDHKITTSEYEKILFLANKDQHIDPQEQKLLGQLQELISNGTIDRVPG